MCIRDRREINAFSNPISPKRDLQISIVSKAASPRKVLGAVSYTHLFVKGTVFKAKVAGSAIHITCGEAAVCDI